MKKKTYPITNIGSVSLLMVFIVLCLVTFAVLSLSSSVSDYHISQKTADHNTEYYQADAKAVLYLKDIDTVLQNVYSENPADYLSAAMARLQQNPDLAIHVSPETSVISYEVPVNDSHTLQIRLQLQTPSTPSDGFYKITQWQETVTADWNGNDKLNLMK